jgi:hypothetical protein
MLSVRMIRVGECYCERIGEYSRRVRKRDSVLFSVRFGFLGVPLEFHSFVLYAALYIRNAKGCMLKYDAQRQMQ